MGERRQQWDSIVAMTQRMLQHAHDAEWPLLVQMESERRAELERFFTAPVSPQDAASMADGIRALMALDREIMALSVAARDNIARQAGLIAKGRRAGEAYHANR